MKKYAKITFIGLLMIAALLLVSASYTNTINSNGGSFPILNVTNLTVGDTFITSSIDSSGTIEFNNDFGSGGIDFFGSHVNQYYSFSSKTFKHSINGTSDDMVWNMDNVNGDDTVLYMRAPDDISIIFRNDSAVNMFIFGYDGGGNDIRLKNLSNTIILKIKQNGDAWFARDVSAESFTDRTHAPKDTVDVLGELKKIKVKNDDCKGNKCQIDKSSLPSEMVKESEQCVQEDEEGDCTEYQTVQGRDLTYTVSWLLKVNQELLERIEELENANKQK